RLHASLLLTPGRSAGSRLLPYTTLFRSVLDAAHRGTRAGGGQAARARRRALAPRSGPSRDGVAAAARARMGIPPPRAHVGALGGEEGRVPGRISRTQVELRHRDDELRGAAAESVGPDPAAARTHRHPRHAGAHSTDRSRRRRCADGARAARARSGRGGGPRTPQALRGGPRSAAVAAARRARLGASVLAAGGAGPVLHAARI